RHSTGIGEDHGEGLLGGGIPGDQESGRATGVREGRDAGDPGRGRQVPRARQPGASVRARDQPAHRSDRVPQSSGCDRLPRQRGLQGSAEAACGRRSEARHAHHRGRGLTPELLEAYRKTRYVVFGEPPLVLRIGERNADLDELLEAEGVVTAAFITAANPGGKKRGNWENEVANAALVKSQAEAGFRCFEGEGRAPDGSWTEK